MSMFAKIFIVLNLVLSVVLGVLLGALLVQKYDYKAMYRQTAKQADARKAELRKVRQDNQAAEAQLRYKHSRAVKSRTETEKRLNSLRDALKTLSDSLRDVDREVAKLESDKQSLDTSIDELKGRESQLKEEIKALQQERESSYKKASEYDKQHDELYKNNLSLLEKLREEEKQMNKQATRVTDLERLWYYIITRHPQLNVIVPMPEMKGAVTSFAPGLVTIDRGRDHKVRVGGRFSVSRGSNYVGTIEIFNVSKERSTGRLYKDLKTSAWPPRPGDVVTTEKPR